MSPPPAPAASEPLRRPTLTDLPPTAKLAFRFHQGNKLLLYCDGEAHEGDLIEPERWHHLQPGTPLFVRLPGGLEAAPIVKAVVLENLLRPVTDEPENWVLHLDLYPDRPAGQPVGACETVSWLRWQLQTLFVYWPRLPRVVYRRDA